MALFVGISKPDYGLTIAHVSRLCELNWATARDYLNILVSLGVAKKVGMLYQIMRDKDDECDACIFMLNSSLQIKEVI
jgi:predicted transcriptional regulator